MSKLPMKHRGRNAGALEIIEDGAHGLQFGEGSELLRGSFGEDACGVVGKGFDGWSKLDLFKPS